MQTESLALAGLSPQYVFSVDIMGCHQKQKQKNHKERNKQKTALLGLIVLALPPRKRDYKVSPMQVLHTADLVKLSPKFPAPVVIPAIFSVGQQIPALCPTSIAQWFSVNP